MSQSHLILSNAIIMWASQILLLFPQFIFVPYLIGTIGEAGYGIYVLVWSLMMSIEQLERSLQSGVVKYSAGFLAQGRMDQVNGVVSSSFVYSILLAVLACTGTLVAAAFYKAPSNQIAPALVVVGIMLLFSVPLTPYIAVIQSRQRYYVGAIATTISKYVSLIAVVSWFRTMGPSVEALIVIMAGMAFITKFAQMPIAYRLVPGLHNRPSLFNKANFRLIASFGLSTVLASLCLAANSTGVRWLMDSLASTSFVTHLAIMLMPGLLLSQIVGAMTITAMPATSSYEATGDQQMIRELLIRGMRYTTILVLAGLILASLLMRNLLLVWVGPNYVFLAPYALVLFASGAFMQSTSIAHHMLKGLGKLRVVVFIYFVGLAIVPVGLILVVFQIWGNPYVAAIAGLVAGQLVCGCLQIRFCTKAVHADLREVIKRVYAQSLVVAAIVSLVVHSIQAISKSDSLIGDVCVSVLAMLLFFSGCYLFIATSPEQHKVKELMQLATIKITALRRINAARYK